MLVSPSILAADMTRLGEEVIRLEQAGADMIHLDIMDGHFVPNISFGSGVLASLRPLVKIPFDVHLMISEPLKYLDSFKAAGANLITFHYEAVEDIESLIDKIKALNLQVGVSIKPNTNVNVLIPYLSKLDLILVMSVEPGFGGQKFQAESLTKVKALAQMKKEFGYKYLIQIDGGINDETIEPVRNAGCDIVVAGTYLLKHPELKQAIDRLKGK